MTVALPNWLDLTNKCGLVVGAQHCLWLRKGSERTERRSRGHLPQREDRTARAAGLLAEALGNPHYLSPKGSPA